MAVTFASPAHQRLFNDVISELDSLGYRGDLLERNYRFPDFSQDGNPEREIPVATFGQTPVSYKTACFGVVLPEQDRFGKRLIGTYRALAAPLQLEVREDRVVCWAVGRDDDSTTFQGEYFPDQIHHVFRQNAEVWSPESVLRAKSIGKPRTIRQLDFFDMGLIPWLEDQVEEKLDPMLRDAVATAKHQYSVTSGARVNEKELFRLAFRLLAGKIFHDREVSPFNALTLDEGPDAVLARVAEHYDEPVPRLLNKAAREAAFRVIWASPNFKHLSIDVLTSIWSKTLVTPATRKALGIHPTPRTVANYIVSRLPQECFANLRENRQLVVEPCCGSATFLVEAMDRIRDELPPTMPPRRRHAYFQDVLYGFEVETFGVEIARLCLGLADFPNANGWNIFEENVFTSVHLPDALRHARVVLCNPPFQSVKPSDPMRKNMESPHKPVEILRRVLDDLNPSGVLGFVLPRKFLDAARYRPARLELVRRFAQLELVSLPDIAFRDSGAFHETVLVLAKQPREVAGSETAVRHLRVEKRDWDRFRKLHRPTTDDEAVRTIDDAKRSLAVPLLGEVWARLSRMQKLGEIATTSRGIEWERPLRLRGQETGNRELYVLDEPDPPRTREGVPPLAKILSFRRPETKHLVMDPDEQRRNAYLADWDRPKVILNASRKSRGAWRISAFADFDGLTCYRTFLAAWPNDPALTVVLAAVLNSPVANAFFATLGGTNIDQDDLKLFPIPKFSDADRRDIEKAVQRYQQVAAAENWEADVALRLVDSLVLKAYGLPARLERKLLDYFDGHGETRPVGITFENYFPKGFTATVPLHVYLSSDFQKSTARNLLKAAPAVTDPELLAALEEVE